MKFSLLEQQIISLYQKDFPLCSSPFLAMAKQLNCSEQLVISTLEKLQKNQVISRVGAVFDHKKAGASTLAAIAVEPEKIDQIAALVNAFEQVNHNYAREHQFNLWFVVTAANETDLNTVIKQIEQITGYSVLKLPMERAFHIDLSFAVDFTEQKGSALC
jgi:DNA-binding Lrp family transcriptional regulator